MKIYGRIYKIINLINNKCYVGLTTLSLSERFKAHCERGRKDSSYVQTAIKKYGKQNFSIVELDVAFSKEELQSKEISWIKKLDTYNNGYNLTIGGESPFLTPEIRAKISLSKKNKPNLKLKNREITYKQRIEISRTLGGNTVEAVNKKTGEVLHFDYVKQTSLFGFNPSLVCAVIKGKRNSHKGFIFKYVSDVNPDLIKETKKSLAVQRIPSETANAEHNLGKRPQLHV
jgi:group I intron endonuclease